MPTYKYDDAASVGVTSDDRLTQRLAAVERAVVDGDAGIDELEELADLRADLDALESRLETHERRLATLESRLEAVGGFVGNVESVNADVERRADAAVAAVDRLESRIDELERAVSQESGDQSSDGSPPAVGEKRAVTDGGDGSDFDGPDAPDRDVTAECSGDGYDRPERAATAILSGTEPAELDEEPETPTDPPVDDPSSPLAAVVSSIRSRLP